MHRFEYFTLINSKGLKDDRSENQGKRIINHMKYVTLTSRARNLVTDTTCVQAFRDDEMLGMVAGLVKGVN